MLAEILIPLDGSAVAEAILPYVVPLVQGGLGRLTLLRVVPRLLHRSGADPQSIMSRTQASYHAEEVQAAGAYLTALAAPLQGGGWPVHCQVLEGDPALTLAAYAAACPDLRLIAMVTHGRSGVLRWVCGSVAEALLHAVPAPLLLVRRPGTPPDLHPQPYRTIVVGLDGSVLAEAALDAAAALAQASGARLHLVAAAPALGAHTAHGISGLAPVPDADAALATHLRVYLQATAARLAAEGQSIDTHLVTGPAATALLDTAATLGADVIVLATHGRSGWQAVRFGSVALEVVQAADRPVLLVRATPPPPAAAIVAAPAAVLRRAPVLYAGAGPAGPAIKESV